MAAIKFLFFFYSITYDSYSETSWQNETNTSGIVLMFAILIFEHRRPRNVFFKVVDHKAPFDGYC